MKSSLIIDTQNTAGKTLQKTITYINPEAPNSDLKTFAQKITAISTDSFINADRVNKINVDDSDGGNSKSEPTLTVDSSNQITYNGDGKLFIAAKDSDSEIYFRIMNNAVSAKLASGSTPSSYDCVIYASEGDNFAAKSISHHWQAS